MKGRKDFIIRTIERLTEVTKEQMIDKTRKREIVAARHLAMYFFKLDDALITHRGIGEAFGNRDHSSVIHAYGNIDDLYATDKMFKKLADDICSEIRPKYSALLGKLSLDTTESNKLRKYNLNRNKIKRVVTVDNKA